MNTPYRTLACLLIIAMCFCTFVSSPSAIAQTGPTGASQTPDAGFSQDELQRLAEPAASPAAPASRPAPGFKNSLNFLSLLIDGGWLMIPIAVMSLLVVTIGFERFIALRRSRLFPGQLRREIRRADSQPARATTTVLYAAATRHRSAAGRILEDVVLKAGRPLREAERCIAEGAQREADYLFGNVRWLTMAAAVTPLIGLLGTVWGMIIAFYNTTQLGAGMNKAEFLAEGIYVALVTTLGGLAVAIPAAILAHYFEGRITRILAIVDTELRSLLPILESLEGQGRFDSGSQEFKSASKTATSSARAAATPTPKSVKKASRQQAT